MEAIAIIATAVGCTYVVSRMIQMFATAPPGQAGKVVRGAAVTTVVAAAYGLVRLALL